MKAGAVACEMTVVSPSTPPSARAMRSPSPRRGPSLHLDAQLGALVLEDDGEGFDDLLVLVRLAVDDDLVLDVLALLDVEEVLLGEAVVPAAVPGGERVRVFLEGVG